ncbi:MAG: slipin family protein [Verrucomicrobiota bacterium]
MNLLLFKYVRVPYEHLGLKFREGQFIGLIRPGSHWVFDPFDRIVIRVLTQTIPKIDLHEPKLKQLKDHPEVATLAQFVDLDDTERGLVWFDGRFQGILTPGFYGYWITRSEIRIEKVAIDTVRFAHPHIDAITRRPESSHELDLREIPEGHVGILYVDGHPTGELHAGRYAFWRDSGTLRVSVFDLRELVLDLSGQEVMTEDKASISLNAVTAYQIRDASLLAGSTVEPERMLHRETQLVLRTEVGKRTLDRLLSSRSLVESEVFGKLIERASKYGIKVKSFGIRDITLPQEIREHLNRVIEAEKAAEANGIKRREDTATMRSQLNAAKLIEQNPTLLRLRELQTVEKITEKAHLQIIVGDGQDLKTRLEKLI